MAHPIRICAVCGEEFELKPDKPGFANRCPDCSEVEADSASQRQRSGEERKGTSELNAERRRAMRDLLYRKDS